MKEDTQQKTQEWSGTWKSQEHKHCKISVQWLLEGALFSMIIYIEAYKMKSLQNSYYLFPYLQNVIWVFS